MSDDTTVRLTEGGPLRMRGAGQTRERGESWTVSAEKAAALADVHDYIEIVDEAAAADEPDADAEDSREAAESLDELTKSELYDRATERDIDGRSEMTKAELIDALE